jgi:DNA-binding MarR family transcriptional regulator
MDDPDGNIMSTTARIRLKVAVLYADRPADLDLVRSDIRSFADLFEMPIAGEFMPQIRSVSPDLVVIYLGPQASTAFARGVLRVLRGGARKLIVFGDRALLADADFGIELIGHSFTDAAIGDEAIRTLIRRNTAFMAGFKRRIGRIDSYLHRMNDLSQDIMMQHVDMVNLYREEPADGLRDAGTGSAMIAGGPVTTVDAGLDVIKALNNALGDEFMSVEYFQILMFLHRGALTGRRGVPVGELCALINAPYSTTVRRIDELAKKDYVRKMTDTADKRRINVEITNRSIGIVEIFLGRFRTSIARLVEGRGDQPD